MSAGEVLPFWTGEGDHEERGGGTTGKRFLLPILALLLLAGSGSATAQKVKGPGSYAVRLALSSRLVEAPGHPVWVGEHASFISLRLEPKVSLRAEDRVVLTDGTVLFSSGTIFAEVPSAHEGLICTTSLARPKGRVGNYCLADTNRDGLFEQATGMGFLPGFEVLHLPKTRFAIIPVRMSRVEPTASRAGYDAWIQVSRVDPMSATVDLCLKKNVVDTVPIGNQIRGFEPTCLSGRQTVSLTSLPVKFTFGQVDLEIVDHREDRVLIGLAKSGTTRNVDRTTGN